MRPPPVIAPVLPNQNQLYAYYLARCGHHRVKKPNHGVLHLLVEDVASHEIRLQAEAKARQVAVRELEDIEEDNVETRRLREQAQSLAEQKCVRIADVSRVKDGAADGLYVGARGMFALMDLLEVLPLMEELDLSGIASWYAGDAFAADGYHGNDVVDRLCQLIRSHPRLRRVNLRGQPLGTLAAQQLLETIRACSHLVEVEVDPEGIDHRLVAQLGVALRDNREHRYDDGAAVAGASASPAALPALSLPSFLADLPILDRKTIREQQVLRALLEEDAHFADHLSSEAMSSLVLHARTMSTTEVIFRCAAGGLRGDGEHLFVLKSGVIRAEMDLVGFPLQRGDYFGDTYNELSFPTCRLVEVERGVAYCFPLAWCGPLLEVWGQRLSELYWPLRTAPFLQSVDMWTRLRTCTCGEVQTYEPGVEVVARGDARKRLWIVREGVFIAMPGSRAEQDITGRYVPYPIHTNEVFGVETIVARKRCTSVPVMTSREKEPTYRVVCVSGMAVRLLTDQLWPVLCSLARPFSVHEDLRQTRLMAVETVDKHPDLMYHI